MGLLIIPKFMEKSCAQCQKVFKISEADKLMLKNLSPVIGDKKIDIPTPNMCPYCRSQRRMAHINQLNLYKRTCDLSGENILSNIHPNAPYKVYKQEIWHSDKWNALEYGMDFDFNRPFFEQFKELLLKVPLPNLFTGYEFDENAEYTNYAGKNKNCYLIFDSDENRDCYYSYGINKCINCIDCFRVNKSELLYQCVDVVNCYSSSFLQNCDNCNDSIFLKNCTGCRNCIMCSNLRNKEYHFQNKPVSKEEYENIKNRLSSYETLLKAKNHFEKFKLNYPQKYMYGTRNENVFGDYLFNCKDAYFCFDSAHIWDGRYVEQGFMSLKNCMDVHECGEAERLYECLDNVYAQYNAYFCNHNIGPNRDIYYCAFCPHTSDSFGCIGLNRKRHCILNKEYSPEEYETLVLKIISHMQKTGEWGEFFPVELSIYAYNETLANHYYPLKREAVLKGGWQWSDELDKDSEEFTGEETVIPDELSHVDDDICKKVLVCQKSGRRYKIIPQELGFYRKMGLPLPRESFFQRHKDRLAMRNPRKLYKRKCAKCGIDIMTTFSPDKPEIVYCEKDYLESIN